MVRVLSGPFETARLGLRNGLLRLKPIVNGRKHSFLNKEESSFHSDTFYQLLLAVLASGYSSTLAFQIQEMIVVHTCVAMSKVCFG